MLDGLTDDEYLWEPVEGCWSIRPRAEARTAQAAGGGDLVADFEYPEPDPAPVTTIAWRIAHIRVGVFGQRNASHFGRRPDRLPERGLGRRRRHRAGGARRGVRPLDQGRGRAQPRRPRPAGRARRGPVRRAPLRRARPPHQPRGHPPRRRDPAAPRPVSSEALSGAERETRRPWNPSRGSSPSSPAAAPAWVVSSSSSSPPRGARSPRATSTPTRWPRPPSWPRRPRRPAPRSPRTSATWPTRREVARFRDEVVEQHDDRPRQPRVQQRRHRRRGQLPRPPAGGVGPHLRRVLGRRLQLLAGPSCRCSSPATTATSSTRAA